MKRAFDIVAVLLLTVLLAVPMAVIALAVRLSSPGPALHWSERIGQNNRIFRMPKFRTMHVGTLPVATHLLANADVHITLLGRFLRRSSIDELPQLLSVIVGHMSLVGPRPALFNQYDLIELRTAQGIHCLRPGVTGWAQINGRDELPIDHKVRLDAEYLARRSLAFDIKIIWLTIWRVAHREGIAH